MSPVLAARHIVVTDNAGFFGEAGNMLGNESFIHSDTVALITGHGLFCAVNKLMMTGQAGFGPFLMFAMLEDHRSACVNHGNSLGNSVIGLGKQIAEKCYYG